MRPFTLILPYYDNPGMLREQQRWWETYPTEVGAALHVIVVDDGSPHYPAVDLYRSGGGVASLHIYRIGVDVRWNWLACRNLAAFRTETPWLLMTDMDHVVPADTWRRVMAGPLEDDVAYRFARMTAPDMTPYKPHPNSWAMTRALFDRIGGYDERFSGYYGTDADFRDRTAAAARAVVILEEAPLVRYPRDVIADASTTTYQRKEARDGANVRRIREARAAIKDWRPWRLTFPWEQQR